jgi:hypothetical protein
VITEPQARILEQKRVLKDFLSSFDFLRMFRFTGFRGAAQEPSTTPAAWVSAIAETGRQYALYLSHSCAVLPGGDWYNGWYAPAPGDYEDQLGLDVPAGNYAIEWLDPATGGSVRRFDREHGGGWIDLRSPRYPIDIALSMRNCGSED